MAVEKEVKDESKPSETAKPLLPTETSSPLTRSETEQSKWDDKGVLIDPELIKYQEKQRKLILGK